jgi:hypothetical protein
LFLSNPLPTQSFLLSHSPKTDSYPLLYTAQFHSLLAHHVMRKEEVLCPTPHGTLGIYVYITIVRGAQVAFTEKHWLLTWALK